MPSRRHVGFCLAGLLIAIPTSSSATPIVDQNFSATPSGMSAILSSSPGGAFGQTFTVGITGLLTGADLLVFDGSSAFGSSGLASDVSVEIRTLLVGVPTDTVLAAGIIPASILPTDPNSALTHVNFASGIIVASGETLALTITGVADGWSGQVGPAATYLGGQAFIKPTVGAWQPFSAFDPGGRPGDFLFRTYVDPTPVPEPGTVVLLALGLTAALRCYRRCLA